MDGSAQWNHPLDQIYRDKVGEARKLGVKAASSKNYFEICNRLILILKFKLFKYLGRTGADVKNSIFYGIRIKQIVAMVFILNLDNIFLKKLFPTMNI